MVIIKFITNEWSDSFTGVIDLNLSKFPHKRFVKNNKVHKFYGPASIWSDSDKSWWFNNKYYGRSIDKYNQKQFFKDLSKQWLL